MQVQGPSRKRYIVSGIPIVPSNQSFSRIALLMIRSEGPLSLFKGLVPSILKTGPSSAVTFLVVGLCRDGWSRWNEEENKASRN